MTMSAHDNREAKLKRVKQTDVQKKMVSGSKGKHAHRESEISIKRSNCWRSLSSLEDASQTCCACRSKVQPDQVTVSASCAFFQLMGALMLVVRQASSVQAVPRLVCSACSVRVIKPAARLPPVRTKAGAKMADSVKVKLACNSKE